MAVVVRPTPYSEPTGAVQETYLDPGYLFLARDGVLVVLDGPEQAEHREVAVFAPGTWLAAEVDEG